MKKFLRLTIDEYAVPAYCSSYKYVFGSFEDLESLINYLRLTSKNSQMVEAFDKYVSGNKKVKYSVAYNSMQMINNCSVIAEREGFIKDFHYDFENIWGVHYTFYADEFSFKRVLINYRKNIIVAIMPSFKNLHIKADGVFSDTFVKNKHWGFPGIYEYRMDDDVNSARVFLVECIYNKDSCEKEDYQKFFDENEFDLKECFEEIVGDG